MIKRETEHPPTIVLGNLAIFLYPLYVVFQELTAHIRQKRRVADSEQIESVTLQQLIDGHQLHPGGIDIGEHFPQRLVSLHAHVANTNSVTPCHRQIHQFLDFPFDSVHIIFVIQKLVIFKVKMACRRPTWATTLWAVV